MTLETLNRIWPHIVGVLTLFIALLTAGHAVLHKRDSRAAVLWVGLIWFVPVLGPVLYLCFGINRIRRRAILLRAANTLHSEFSTLHSKEGQHFSLSAPHSTLPSPPHLRDLSLLVGRVVGRPLIPGNCVEPLVNGDDAYPAILDAIDAATTSITLTTYIFDNDTSGRIFVEALKRAVERGVAVRVLIDSAGTHYSFPPIVVPLRRAGVRVARFLPTVAPWRLMTMNMRSHRKILVVDGRIGFTGGMNFRAGNLLKDNPRCPVQDLHFKLQGPVVAQLQEAFAADWAFTTREILEGNAWFPKLDVKGHVVARAIPDGPDEDFEKLRWTILGALACARKCVIIVTPYFLPDPAVISSLNLAALRGVSVDIVLPSKSNLSYVHWASRAMWWQVLKRGCRVWLTPPPFDHSKLMLVDDHWALLGSANWDPRSLRLNFEFNVECYGDELVECLTTIAKSKMNHPDSHQVSLKEVDQRGLPSKLRDGIARLFTPYL